MTIAIRPYTEGDLPAMLAIWNQVVEEGVAFPQDEPLDEETGRAFFARQTHTAVAEDTDTAALVGLYILHPNNVGRCGHISNASYAVSADCRGRHIGEKLVKDCLLQAQKLGFRILQFNAVVAANTAARHLYERLGFQQLGVIPGGFLMKDGTYEDICPYYRVLSPAVREENTIRIYQLLSEIRKRPALYLGRLSLLILNAYIDGYLHDKAEYDPASGRFMARFQIYVEKWYHSNTTHGWAELIELNEGTGDEGMKAFYKLLDKYVEEKAWENEKLDPLYYHIKATEDSLGIHRDN